MKKLNLKEKQHHNFGFPTIKLPVCTKNLQRPTR